MNNCTLSLVLMGSLFAANPAQASDMADIERSALRSDAAEPPVENGVERSALTASSLDRDERFSLRSPKQRRQLAFGYGMVGVGSGALTGAVGSVAFVVAFTNCGLFSCGATGDAIAGGVMLGATTLGAVFGAGAGASLGGGYALAPSLGGAALGTLAAMPLLVALSPIMGMPGVFFPAAMVVLALPVGGAAWAGSSFARKHALSVVPRVSGDRGLALSGTF